MKDFAPKETALSEKLPIVTTLKKITDRDGAASKEKEIVAHAAVDGKMLNFTIVAGLKGFVYLLVSKKVATLPEAVLQTLRNIPFQNWTSKPVAWRLKSSLVESQIAHQLNQRLHPIQIADRFKELVGANLVAMKVGVSEDEKVKEINKIFGDVNKQLKISAGDKALYEGKVAWVTRHIICKSHFPATVRAQILQYMDNDWKTGPWGIDQYWSSGMLFVGVLVRKVLHPSWKVIFSTTAEGVHLLCKTHLAAIARGKDRPTGDDFVQKGSNCHMAEQIVSRILKPRGLSEAEVGELLGRNIGGSL